MPTTVHVCPKCGTRSPSGTRYCPTCGEAIDPALVKELNALYSKVRTLDELIADGEGDRSVREVREALLSHYLAQRTAAPGSGSAAVAPTAAPALAPASASLAAAVAATATAAATTNQATVQPLRAPQPPRPVFSWREFLAEQAIAIMAYLGGFLLLVATLSFEVGAWQVLDNAVKLAIVCAVYVVFGALGFVLRRSTRLRTVGRAYLGVFALMTPLVGLATYRFALQGTGFPVAGMVCAAAAYAAAIYLVLAARTSFIAYAYLGWMALVVTALAIPSWAGADRSWGIVTLAVVALVLLAPRSLQCFRSAALLADPALHIAALASVVAALGAETLGLNLWSGGQFLPGVSFPIAAFTFGACALVPLTLAWSFTLRSLAERLNPAIVAAVDWLVAGFVAQAAIGIATLAGADYRAMAQLLGALAVAELAGAIGLWRRDVHRAELRYAVEALAIILAAIGAVIVWPDPSPNHPLIVALSCGTVAALGLALLQRAPWLALLAGLFFLPDYHAILLGFIPSGAFAANPFTTEASALHAALLMSISEAGLALALWAVALGVGLSARSRAYAGPLFAVALANALYTLVFLPGQSSMLQTIVLVLFALAAVAAGWRLREPISGNIAAGIFGALAVLPFTVYTNNGLAVAGTMVAAAVAALAIRGVLGRAYTYAPYAVALWAALAGGLALTTFDLSTTRWSLLGISFAAWALLAVAAIATAAALWEDQPAIMVVPAALGPAAVVITQNSVAAFVLVLVLIAGGAALRQVKGRWWNVALLGAAIPASASAVIGLNDLGAAAANWQVAELFAFAAIAYLVAVQERQPLATTAGFAYALAATTLLPGPNNLIPTLLVTFASVALGIGLRLRCGRGWALAFYAVAAQASIFAVSRAAGSGPGVVEALLLIFAAVAYLVAVGEGEPVAGFAPLLYAGWAVYVQSDPHALLPLALSLAVAGFAAGRIVGPRWSWPGYLAAASAAGATAFLGRSAPGFEALALLALAVAAYALATLESRADVLPLALVLGMLALASGSTALQWNELQGGLAFAGLCWLYFGGSWLWQRLPGIHARGEASWTAQLAIERLQAWERDPRGSGALIHRWTALLLAAGLCVAALTAPDAFTPHAVHTEAVVIEFLSLAGLLALHAVTSDMRVALYAAGELVAVAISWQARWFGADNLQAFVLAPGSYQLLVSALAPHDQRLGRPQGIGQVFALVGAAVLLLPTLAQSFQTDPNWLYALILTLEALVLAAIGIGTHSRPLVLAGSAFVVAAALRGAALAVNSGIPIPVVIGALALVLMGGATWLSLRARHSASQTP